jgi:hypothetical protein
LIRDDQAETAWIEIQGVRFKRGKYIGYIILIMAIIFFLEWLQIVDVPFFDIPDYITSKKDMVESTEGAPKQME